MYSIRCPCQVLMKLEFSVQIFEKYSNNQFYENPSSGCRVVPSGQKDGQVIAFRNIAKPP
jgi:hypothetical protein